MSDKMRFCYLKITAILSRAKLLGASACTSMSRKRLGRVMALFLSGWPEETSSGTATGFFFSGADAVAATRIRNYNRIIFLMNADNKKNIINYL